MATLRLGGGELRGSGHWVCGAVLGGGGGGNGIKGGLLSCRRWYLGKMGMEIDHDGAMLCFTPSLVLVELQGYDALRQSRTRLPSRF